MASVDMIFRTRNTGRILDDPEIHEIRIKNQLTIPHWRIKFELFLPPRLMGYFICNRSALVLAFV